MSSWLGILGTILSFIIIPGLIVFPIIYWIVEGVFPTLYFILWGVAILGFILMNISDKKLKK